MGLLNVQWEQDHTEAPAGVDLAGELEGEDMGVSWDGRGRRKNGECFWNLNRSAA
jgi:hypothetical protein